MEIGKKNYSCISIVLAVAVGLCLIIILRLISIISDDRVWLKGNQDTIVGQFETLENVTSKHRKELKARDDTIKLKEGDTLRLENESKIAKNASKGR